MIKKYYRYHDIWWTGNRITLMITEFKVVKETKCGVWIQLEYGQKDKFILNDAKKKYANPTIEEALESFRARKKRQIQILTVQLERAKLALEADPNVGFFKAR